MHRQGETNDRTTEDRELVFQFKQGSQQAFSQIVHRYQKPIFKLAYGFCQDQDDAMEIVQETFMRVYQKIDRFDDESSFSNWIYRVARNLCIDYHRKFKKRRLSNQDMYRHLREEQDQRIELDPEKQAAQSLVKEKIKDSVHLLPKQQKLVFILRNFEHLKFREISDVLGISVGTAKSLHHRALNQLKKEVLKVSWEFSS